MVNSKIFSGKYGIVLKRSRQGVITLHLTANLLENPFIQRMQSFHLMVQYRGHRMGALPIWHFLQGRHCVRPLSCSVKVSCGHGPQVPCVKGAVHCSLTYSPVKICKQLEFLSLRFQVYNQQNRWSFTYQQDSSSSSGFHVCTLGSLGRRHVGLLVSLEMQTSQKPP